MASLSDILVRIKDKATRIWMEWFLTTWFSAAAQAGASPLADSDGKIDGAYISQGSGSGFDADTLDGHEATYFQVALPDSANLVYKDASNTYSTGTQNFLDAILRLPLINKSTSTVLCEMWISKTSDAKLYYRDGLVSGSGGITHTVEVQDNKDSASGYCGLDSSSKVEKSKISTTGKFVNGDLPTKTFFGDQDNTLDASKTLDTSAGNLVIPSLSSDPSSPVEGQLWFRSDTLQMCIRSGGATLRRAFA